MRGCLGILALALVGAACSAPTVRNTTVATGHGPGGTNLPSFPSGQDFYRLGPHVRPELPGQLYRIQQVSNTGVVTTLRVMYHSRDGSGHDALVTGLVSYPEGSPPKGGWPVVSWDHGTTGLSQGCAPSRSGRAVGTFGLGAVGVATDYLGLGPDGEIHPYLNRVTEARATTDIVRAAREIPDAHAGGTWAVAGESQGGHAALATGEIAPGYAPELNLVGTVAIAPAAELAQTFPGDSPIVDDFATVMGIFGAQAADPKVNPNEFLLPAAQGVASVVRSGCEVQIADFLLGVYISSGTVFSTPPVDTSEGRSFMEANDVGRVHTASPILLVGGGQDPIVVPARFDALLNHLCEVHDRVSLDWLPDGNHSTETGLATQKIHDWIESRLEGGRTSTNCPAIPPKGPPHSPQ